MVIPMMRVMQARVAMPPEQWMVVRDRGVGLRAARRPVRSARGAVDTAARRRVRPDLRSTLRPGGGRAAENERDCESEDFRGHVPRPASGLAAMQDEQEAGCIVPCRRCFPRITSNQRCTAEASGSSVA